MHWAGGIDSAPILSGARGFPRHPFLRRARFRRKAAMRRRRRSELRRREPARTTACRLPLQQVDARRLGPVEQLGGAAEIADTLDLQGEIILAGNVRYFARHLPAVLTDKERGGTIRGASACKRAGSDRPIQSGQRAHPSSRDRQPCMDSTAPACYAGPSSQLEILFQSRRGTCG